MSQNPLIAELAESAKPVRPVKMAKRLLWMVLLVTLYISALILLRGLRDDWMMQIQTLAYQMEMGISLLLVYGAGALAMRLSVPCEKRFPLAWLLLIGAATLGAVIALLGEVSMESLQRSLASDHFYITFGVCALAAPVAIGLLWVQRKGSPTQLGWAGAMALLAASAVGHFIMRTIGKAANYAEVLVWCYPPVLLLALVGVLVGRKILRW